MKCKDESAADQQYQEAVAGQLLQENKEGRSKAFEMRDRTAPAHGGTSMGRALCAGLASVEKERMSSFSQELGSLPSRTGAFTTSNFSVRAYMLEGSRPNVGGVMEVLLESPGYRPTKRSGGFGAASGAAVLVNVEGSADVSTVARGMCAHRRNVAFEDQASVVCAPIFQEQDASLTFVSRCDVDGRNDQRLPAFDIHFANEIPGNRRTDFTAFERLHVSFMRM